MSAEDARRRLQAERDERQAALRASQEAEKVVDSRMAQPSSSRPVDGENIRERMARERMERQAQLELQQFARNQNDTSETPTKSNDSRADLVISRTRNELGGAPLSKSAAPTPSASVGLPMEFRAYKENKIGKIFLTIFGDFTPDD